MLTKRTYTLIELEKVDSTSMYISRNAEHLANFSVVSAKEQTAGRGQGDHKWHSSPGENLTFSLFLKYDGDHIVKAADQQILTMASSLAVTDFLKKEFGIEAGIKKPNDIYVEGKKICGMLIENGLKGADMQWSIIGMGININQTSFPADLPNPVSVSQLTGNQYDTEKCLKSFLRHFTTRFDAIWTESRTLKDEYQARIISLRQ